MLQLEAKAGSSHVSLPVPVSFEDAVAHRQQHVHPYIELATVVQQRIGDILLQDKCSSGVLAGNSLLHRSKAIATGDTSASVGMLTRLYDPHSTASVSQLSLLEGFDKLTIDWIVDTPLDMECQWHYRRQVDLVQLAVFLKDVIQCFLVPEHSVIGKVIVLDLSALRLGDGEPEHTSSDIPCRLVFELSNAR